MRCLQQRMLGSAPTDLDQRFTVGQQRGNVSPRVAQQLTQKRVARVAAGQPDNLGWWAQARHEIDKITVLREHDRRPLFTCAGKDVGIFRTAQAEVPHGDRVDLQFLAHPPRKSRRHLRVNPDLHGSRRENGVPQATARKPQTRGDILTG